MSVFSISEILVSIIIAIFVTLLIDNSYIRFKTEKIVRNIFKRKLLFFELNTRCIYCSDGLLFLHGLSIKNKMWFTHKLPKTFCNSPTTLNWRGFCDYFSNIYFKNASDKKVKKVFKEYKKCILQSTSHPSKIHIDIHKETKSTVEIIAEYVEIEKNVPLNSQKIVGDLHLGSRNHMPILNPGYKTTIMVFSKEFGFIDKVKIKIPDNLKEIEPIENLEDLVNLKENSILLQDIGVVGLRWPVRFIIEDRLKTSD